MHIQVEPSVRTIVNATSFSVPESTGGANLLAGGEANGSDSFIACVVGYFVIAVWASWAAANIHFERGKLNRHFFREEKLLAQSYFKLS